MIRAWVTSVTTILLLADTNEVNVIVHYSKVWFLTFIQTSCSCREILISSLVDSWKSYVIGYADLQSFTLDFSWSVEFWCQFFKYLLLDAMVNYDINWIIPSLRNPVLPRFLWNICSSLTVSAVGCLSKLFISKCCLCRCRALNISRSEWYV